MITEHLSPPWINLGEGYSENNIKNEFGDSDDLIVNISETVNSNFQVPLPQWDCWGGGLTSETVSIYLRTKQIDFISYFIVLNFNEESQK